MKTLRIFPRSALALALGCLGLAASPAPAQTVITSVPTIISASGHYILNDNLTSSSTTSPAIKITAPNVVLDLNGYYVAGPGNPAAGNNVDNSVIQVGDVPDVTIKNGTVSGHVTGIIFLDSISANGRNHIIDKVTVTRCYIYGIYSYGHSPGSAVKRCSVSTIGGSSSANTNPYAICTDGGFRIQNNNVSGVKATGTGTARGIRGGPSDFLIGNTVADCDIGLEGSKCLDNLTYNVATPFKYTTNATGNN